MSVSSSRASIKIAMLALGACLLSLPAIAQDYGPAECAFHAEAVARFRAANREETAQYDRTA